MKGYPSLGHTRWDGKYPVVLIPKKRRKRIFGGLRRYLGELFHELALHKESKIVEGHLMVGHVHMCISIPPKYVVSNVVGQGQIIKSLLTTVGYNDRVSAEFIPWGIKKDGRIDHRTFLYAEGSAHRAS